MRVWQHLAGRFQAETEEKMVGGRGGEWGVGEMYAAHMNVWCLSTDPTENGAGTKPCTFAA